MATPITFTVLTKGGSDTDADDYTTASCAFSSHPGKMFVAVVVGYDLGNGAVESGTCSGGGLTWSSAQGGQGVNSFWIRYFRASGTGSDGAVTFTNIADAGQTLDGAAWMVLAIGGVNTDTNNGQVQVLGFDALNRTTEDTLTLVALNAFGSSDNANVAFFASNDTAGGTLNFTEGDGFTAIDEIDQIAGGDRVTLFAEYKLNDTTADASVSAANDRLIGTAMEIEVKGPQLTGISSATGFSTITM